MTATTSMRARVHGRVTVLHLVDRRGLSPHGRGVAALDGLDRLEVGHALLLLDDHEPRQLAELLGVLGYDVATTWVAGSWRSIVRRVPAPASASDRPTTT